ncbi:AAA family ATPase [Pandoraea norimbergensis]|uniref:ATPase AAA-type core domain-containing protein n=1 Tax=Pandoraea norimbergensis TaxID=93219 RepID=A0ABM5WH76_9BURK|nr:AAA family ATPase [Pandoraea norimbergensis]
MRIESLKILSPWKNLEGFEIDFHLEKDVTVLLGRNGAAKSNLLEAIITIFTRIDLAEVAEFSFDIRYEINGQKVQVTADAGRQPLAKLNTDSIPLTQLRSKWSPKYVVGYYSGVSDRFEKLFQRHDRRALDETLVDTTQKNSEKPSTLALRQFIYARPVHGLFSLLAFYFSDDAHVMEFMRSVLRIDSFDSALLVVKKPEWASPKAKAENFWDAKGPVRDLLERFRQYSLAPFFNTFSRPEGFRKRSRQHELMYLFLPDVDALHKLASEYGGDQRALFQALDTMRLSDLVDDFRVRVRIQGATTAIHTRQLSEGEQQLLTVLGLMRFTRNDASLYLLDEPDTHLNPAWGMDYLEDLRNIGGLHRNSHTLIASHQPLLVAGLLKDEIRVLRRGVDGRVDVVTPTESPRGTGVAGVLTSPLYGLESQLDRFSLSVLKRIYEVSLESKSDRRARYLRRLRRLVPSLEIAESSPDPFRNIARQAYQLSLDRALHTSDLAGNRVELVERLASNLFEGAAKEEE